MATYIIAVMPYKSPLSKILSIMNELLLLLMIAICVRFVNPQIDPNLSKKIGLVLVAVLIATIALNWIGIITYGLIITIQKHLSKKAIKLRAERLKEIQDYIDKSVETESERLQKTNNSKRSVRRRKTLTNYS